MRSSEICCYHYRAWKFADGLFFSILRAFLDLKTMIRELVILSINLIREHHPAWLGKDVVKGIRGSIVEHPVDTVHQVEIENAFSVCYKVTSRAPQGVRFRLLCALLKSSKQKETASSALFSFRLSTLMNDDEFPIEDEIIENKALFAKHCCFLLQFT